MRREGRRRGWNGIEVNSSSFKSFVSSIQILSVIRVYVHTAVGQILDVSFVSYGMSYH